MTDAAFVLSRTNADRKSMSAGSYHKKCGSKSKKCTMPSDYMTTKQKKGLSGAVTSFKTKVLTYDEFKSYLHDIQQDVLKTYESHGARMSDLADYFSTTIVSIASYLRNNSLNFVSAYRKKHTPSHEWLDYIKDSKSENCPAEIIEEKPDNVAIDYSKFKCANKVAYKFLGPKSGTLHFEGAPEEAFTTLMGILEHEGVYRFDISFIAEEKGEKLIAD